MAEFATKDITPAPIPERIGKYEIIKEVGRFNGSSAIFFPERTNDIPNPSATTWLVAAVPKN